MIPWIHLSTQSCDTNSNTIDPRLDFARIDSLCFNSTRPDLIMFVSTQRSFLCLIWFYRTRFSSTRIYLVRPDLMIWFKSTKFVLFRVCFAILDYFWFDPTRFGLIQSILFDLIDSILRGLNRFCLTQ